MKMHTPISQHPRSSRTAVACAALFLGAAPSCQDLPSESAGSEPLAQASLPLQLSSFQGWQQVPGGNAMGSPGATMRGTNNVHLFVRGTDNNLYSNYGFKVLSQSPWDWVGWQFMGGGPVVDGASATIWSFNGTNEAVVVRKTEGSAAVASVNVCLVQPNGSCSFAGWNTIPNGNLANDPAIVEVSQSFHRFLYVIGAGTNNQVFWTRNETTNGYNPSNWTGWTVIPHGVVDARIAATALGETLFVVGRGTDNRYYLNKSSDGGTSWNGWALVVDQQFSSGPALSSWTGGHLDLFGTVLTGGQNAVFGGTSTNSGASWGSFQNVANSALVGAPAAWSPAVGSIQLFGTGNDNPGHVYRNIYQE